MMNVKGLFKFAVPVGLSALCWLTMRTVAAYGDESMTSYGFPFPWYAPSGASSMAFDVAIGPLIVNIVSYVSIGYIVTSLIIPASMISTRGGNILSVVLWFAAFGSLALTFTGISLDPHFVNWTMDSYFSENAKRSHGFQFGPGRGP